MTAIELKKEGWKEWHITPLDRCNRHWFKRVDSRNRCQCNSDKEGMQVELREWKYESFQAGYDLHIAGELEDGRWPQITLSVDDNMESINAGVELIIYLWEKANER